MIILFGFFPVCDPVIAHQLAILSDQSPFMAVVPTSTARTKGTLGWIPLLIGPCSVLYSGVSE
jgi:hypothetical protein